MIKAMILHVKTQCGVLYLPLRKSTKIIKFYLILTAGILPVHRR